MKNRLLAGLLMVLLVTVIPALSQQYNTVYGPGIHMDALGNTQIGGPDCGCSGYRRTAFRFKANTTAQLSSVRVSWPNGAGYANVDTINHLPTVKIELQSDDGSTNHNPSGTVIATLFTGAVDGVPVWQTLSFSSPPTLTKGTYYHLVATNTSAAPATYYRSWDGIYQVTPDANPRQPKYADDSFAIEYKDGPSTAWVVRADSTNTPLFQLNYSDGTVDGVGYFEINGYPMPTNGKHVSGANELRETFTPSLFDVTTSGVAIHIAKVSGTDPLTVRLELSDGTLIEQGTIPAATFTSATYGTWGVYTFSQVRTLAKGTTYHLVLTAPGTSDYASASMHDGSDPGSGEGYAGKDGNSVFGDGWAQYSTDTGSTWTNWGSSGSTNADTDMEFYFIKASSPCQ